MLVPHQSTSWPPRSAAGRGGRGRPQLRGGLWDCAKQSIPRVNELPGELAAYAGWRGTVQSQLVVMRWCSTPCPAPHPAWLLLHSGGGGCRQGVDDCITQWGHSELYSGRQQRHPSSTPTPFLATHTRACCFGRQRWPQHNVHGDYEIRPMVPQSMRQACRTSSAVGGQSVGCPDG